MWPVELIIKSTLRNLYMFLPTTFRQSLSIGQNVVGLSLACYFTSRAFLLEKLVKFGKIIQILKSFYSMMAGSSCSTGWCGRDYRPRTFDDYDPVICYDSPPAAKVNRTHYDNLRFNCLLGDKVQEFEVARKSAKTWEMKKDDLCRITVSEGPQVGDMNFWNLHDRKEKFYSGKTRQLHATHLTVYHRLWSNLPYLRPMATIVEDSLKGYGIDKDGGSVHDVIGTRCDDYTYKLITGNERNNSCHSFLRKSLMEIGMDESDIHDVWNIFMCTGFTRDTHQYFCKPSPAKKGDYIGFIADMDLLVALSTCPQGDVSTPVGQYVPDDKCFPLKVEVYRSK